jgi:hypothetical protein
VLPSPGLTSYGFGARLSRRRKSPWGWSVDLVADGGRVPSSLGTGSIDTLSAGPSLFLEKAWDWFAVEGDAGLRLGAAHLKVGAAPSPIHGQVETSDVSVGGVWLSAHVGAVFFFFWRRAVFSKEQHLVGEARLNMNRTFRVTSSVFASTCAV